MRLRLPTAMWRQTAKYWRAVGLGVVAGLACAVVAGGIGADRGRGKACRRHA